MQPPWTRSPTAPLLTWQLCCAVVAGSRRQSTSAVSPWTRSPTSSRPWSAAARPTSRWASSSRRGGATEGMSRNAHAGTSAWVPYVALRQGCEQMGILNQGCTCVGGWVLQTRCPRGPGVRGHGPRGKPPAARSSEPSTHPHARGEQALSDFQRANRLDTATTETREAEKRLRDIVTGRRAAANGGGQQVAAGKASAPKAPASGRAVGGMPGGEAWRCSRRCCCCHKAVLPPGCPRALPDFRLWAWRTAGTTSRSSWFRLLLTRCDSLALLAGCLPRQAVPGRRHPLPAPGAGGESVLHLA